MLVLGPGYDAKRCHSFSHKAMNTVFEFILCHDDRTYAEQAVWEVIKEVDRLEGELSRYRPNSDISRINTLKRNQRVRLGEDSYACIRECQELCERTGGAFNIACGALLACWVNPDKSPRRPAEAEIGSALKRSVLTDLVLHDDFSVEVKTEGMMLDLGGYAKGYSVDRACGILTEWGIERALISSGFSSVRAMGPPEDREGWEVSISDPARPSEQLLILSLNDLSISGSGLNKGRHIMDPFTGRPVERWGASWALSPSAARSDALSTAFLVAGFDRTERMVSSEAGCSAVLVPYETGLKKEHVHLFGHPPVSRFLLEG